MRTRVAGRCGQDLTNQSFRTRDVGRGRGACLIEHATRERDRQPTLCLDGTGIESQRTLIPTDPLRIAVARWGLQPGGASPEDVVQRVGMLGRTAGRGLDQFEVECDRDPTCDLVLQGEQIARVAVEPRRPQMRVGFGIDQLGSDADLGSRPLDASFQHIADPEFAADLFGVDRLVLIGKRGIARDHKHMGDP